MGKEDLFGAAAILLVGVVVVEESSTSLHPTKRGLQCKPWMLFIPWSVGYPYTGSALV